jgi:hypothetical protein
MREVQVTCIQCGQTDGYLESEPSDYTSVPTGIIQIPWKCSHCGYPEVKWDRWGNRTYSPTTTIVITVKDADGNPIKVTEEKQLSFV